MGQGRSKRGQLSTRMRAHLAHLRACEASGEALKHYAARKGLSIHALYQAKKVLLEEGLLNGRKVSGDEGGRQAKSEAGRFVEVVAPVGARVDGPLAWRIRLPGGAVLESRTPLGVEEVVRLIEVLGGRA